MNECNVGFKDFNPLFRGMFCRLIAERARHRIEECSEFPFGFTEQRLTSYSDGAAVIS